MGHGVSPPRGDVAHDHAGDLERVPGAMRAAEIAGEDAGLEAAAGAVRLGKRCLEVRDPRERRQGPKATTGWVPARMSRNVPELVSRNFGGSRQQS